VLALSAATGLAADAKLARKIVLAHVSTAAPLPADLVRPEGRTRWDLTGAKAERESTLTVSAEGGIVTVIEEGPGGEILSRSAFSSPDGGDDALRWHFPERVGASLRPGSRATYEIEEEGPGGVDRLRITAGTLGIGWVHLPSGPREAVLQRALVERAPGRSPNFHPEAIVDRWIDPRAGVVASSIGPTSPDGRRARIASATTVVSVLAGASMLTISVSELEEQPFGSILYGFDLGTVNISTLDPNGYTTMGQMVAQDVWDFSGNTTGNEIAFTVAPIDANQTCNTASCGYDHPGSLLERNDFGFDDPNPANWTKINTVVEQEVRANDVTIWLRAGSINEGVAGSFGTGESRLCFQTFGGTTRTPVPLWRFSHMGATERYFQPGDTWEGGPFNCEQNLFNQVCGAPGLFDTLYSKACGTHTGKQTITAIKGGVVTLPSGHTFNAILLSNVADFCVYLGSGCSSLTKVDEVRTVNYLWQVPWLGTVIRLESAQNAPDTTSYTQVVETTISYGLFPPRSITVTGSTDTTVSLSWDPGAITGRIDGYRVYWDTDSGSTSSYAFSSVTNPGQASIAGTTATISGLTAGTEYFFTVTSTSTYPPSPSTPLPHVTYESILYPTTVSGDPSFVYPAEVLATTTGGTCLPTAEITNVTATGPSGGNIELCWDASADPCLSGYTILGSGTVDSAAGYQTVATQGTATCWSGATTETFFLVTATGTGGDGPWGHYGN
jgi:hypothetical protein